MQLQIPRQVLQNADSGAMKVQAWQEIQMMIILQVMMISDLKETVASYKLSRHIRHAAMNLPQ